MKNIAFVFFFLALLISSCRKDIEEITFIDDPETPTVIEDFVPSVKPVVASVIGFVIDDNGDPVQNALVDMGTLTGETDEYGHFFFKDVEMNKHGTVVQIKKEGYFPGSRRFFPIKDNASRVKIELISRNFDYTFNSQDGGAISLDGGSSIEFSENSIQLEDGTPYNGTVQVAAKWLDPTALQTFDQMPGNLQGANLSNEEVGLTTFGMMAVELRETGGEKLNILAGSTATIKMAVPQALLSSAPATIPLWSYNEDYGIWVEESTARLEDGFYVGEVNHFSFWNCDYPGSVVSFTFEFLNQFDRPLDNFLVTLSIQNGTSGTGYTDDKGSIFGFIPANQELLLEVFDPCGNVIFSQVIDPSSVDIELNFVITIDELSYNTVTGNLINCDGDPITEGMVIIELSNGLVIYSFTEGDSFEINLIDCSNVSEIEISAIDLENLIQSNPLTYPPSQNINAGSISLCNGQGINFMQVTVNELTKAYLEGPNTFFRAQFYDESGTVELGYSSNSPGPSVAINIALIPNFVGVGSYPGTILTVLHDQDTGWSTDGVTIYLEYLNIVEYGLPGEQVKGVFKGEFPGNSDIFEGSFSIEREEP